MKFRAILVAGISLLGAASCVAQKPAPLVVISVDGMKPEYVTQAEAHGLKVPELRSFLRYGTYAEGVVGVLPTVTYPSHTTLMTGVWPAEHGIIANTFFDPDGKHGGGYEMFFKDIKVQTLYGAAGAAGLKTAALGWPVTVGAPIDYLIAEFAQSEKSSWPATGIHHPDDILEQLGIAGNGKDDDGVKVQQAAAILRKFHPDLLLVHLDALDGAEHRQGPFSEKADAAIEVIDGEIATLEKTALEVNPKTRIAVVSDHGFEKTEWHVNLNVLLVQAGLITLRPGESKKSAITAWKAEAWGGGALNAVEVNADDPAVIAKVREILHAAQANPAYGIDRVLERDEIRRRGGFPTAAFVVNYRAPFYAGSALTGEVVTPHPHSGEHGYLPDDPEMRSSFMIKGAGIARGRDLKVVDMRQIAPTFAGLLDVKLPAAKMKPLPVR